VLTLHLWHPRQREHLGSDLQQHVQHLPSFLPASRLSQLYPVQSVQKYASIQVSVHCWPSWSQALFFAGAAQTGQTTPSRLVTWPTAASKLMTAAPLQQLPDRTHLPPSPSSPQAPPPSPVSSGSAGFLSNKRQKLGTLEPPPGLWLGSRGQQPGHAPVKASHRVTAQQRQGYSDPPAELDTNLESDADTDAATRGSGGRSEGSDDRRSAPGFPPWLGALFDQQFPTQPGSRSDHNVAIDSAGQGTEACLSLLIGRFLEATGQVMGSPSS